MDTNTAPHYDTSVNDTGCCPRFNPEGWDRQTLHFRDKPFVRATTRSVMHIPVNMGSVFSHMQKRIEEEGACDPAETLILSRDLSPWEAEHLFAVRKDIPGEENVRLTGDYVTRVFEGPYRDVKTWHKTMEDEAQKQGKAPGRIFFFYTTCPRCMKVYGENYVVGLVELGDE